MLDRAVAASLAQDLPPGWRLEVVVGVSDPRIATDLEAARALSAADARVRFAEGPGRGAGATRNAAIAVSRGAVLAFTDDDCVPRRDWLREALGALEGADIVQGRTVPAGPVPPRGHSVDIAPPTWLWETCNLLVRRETLERAGGFDESWNAAGRAGNLFQFGEDTELGWRMVRDGARAAFAPSAVVEHEVFARSWWRYLAYHAGVRRFPRLLRSTPEVRRIFHRGYFVNRRHLTLTAAAALGGAGLLARAGGARGAARALAGGALLGLVAPLRHPLARGDLAGAAREARDRLPVDAVEFAAALYGSARWRRLLL
jgi:cellulose synthase/poly-beta-1,6-N-acetylglucosamine synthase-like glycosyltransferase